MNTESERQRLIVKLLDIIDDLDDLVKEIINSSNRQKNSENYGTMEE